MLILLAGLQAVGLAGILLLLRKVSIIMAKLQDLKDALAAVATGVDGLEAAITALKEQIASGTPVTQEELDALLTSVQAIGADIADPSDQGSGSPA